MGQFPLCTWSICLELGRPQASFGIIAPSYHFSRSWVSTPSTGLGGQVWTELVKANFLCRACKVCVSYLLSTLPTSSLTKPPSHLPPLHLEPEVERNCLAAYNVKPWLMLFHLLECLSFPICTCLANPQLYYLRCEVGDILCLFQSYPSWIGPLVHWASLCCVQSSLTEITIYPACMSSSPC